MSNIISRKFEGHSMRFREVSCIDATTTAEKFGKLPNEFLRLTETEAYIRALERRCGKIPYVKTSKARNILLRVPHRFKRHTRGRTSCSIVNITK